MAIDIREFQRWMQEQYGERDRARGSVKQSVYI